MNKYFFLQKFIQASDIPVLVLASCPHVITDWKKALPVFTFKHVYFADVDRVRISFNTVDFFFLSSLFLYSNNLKYAQPMLIIKEKNSYPSNVSKPHSLHEYEWTRIWVLIFLEKRNRIVIWVVALSHMLMRIRISITMRMLCTYGCGYQLHPHTQWFTRRRGGSCILTTLLFILVLNRFHA